MHGRNTRAQCTGAMHGPLEIELFAKVWMACLMHPHVFLVGGDDWEGLQVKTTFEKMRDKI